MTRTTHPPAADAPAVDPTVRLPVDGLQLEGALTIPAGATGIVLFAHGSGSSRLSPRNRFVAAQLQHAGLATLLLDLLTPEEERRDAGTGALRFDIALLAARLGAVSDLMAHRPDTRMLRMGYFGASTGAAAALVAAADRPRTVAAIVSRGGRPDLAGDALPRVMAPTLLVVGGADPEVLDLNHAAMRRLGGPARLQVVPDATHLFPEPGALEEVARLACDWFARHLAPLARPLPPIEAW